MCLKCRRSTLECLIYMIYRLDSGTKVIQGVLLYKRNIRKTQKNSPKVCFFEKRATVFLILV